MLFARVSKQTTERSVLSLEMFKNIKSQITETDGIKHAIKDRNKSIISTLGEIENFTNEIRKEILQRIHNFKDLIRKVIF